MMRGLAEVQADIDSPEADKASEVLSTSSAQRITQLWEEMSLYGAYVHGTHVAGIALAGNPFARLVVVREEPDWHTRPLAATTERVTRFADSIRETVRFFKQEHVRVVNMSWVINPLAMEENLAANGIGRDAEERRAMAFRLYARASGALLDALRSAPEILFICSAANNNADSSFTELAPADFVLTVGTVDSVGEEAEFTNYGPTVKVYANGSEVLSQIPENETMLMSGTSMAAPGAVNLAAKLIALDRELTPAQTIKLIVDGSTASSGRVHLLHPKRSVALLASCCPDVQKQ